MSRVFDCLTFFDENFLTNLRFEILNNYVDFFVICESRFDHKGNKKKLNFKLLNKKFSSKIKYIVMDENFSNPHDGWKAEELQREMLFHGIKDAQDEDYIMYSDSDEIPNPDILKNFSLVKKYGIFLQKFFVYKMNIFNPYETPWEGTRICKKKDFKSFTHLRKKILKKNLNKPFWRLNIEKKIDIFENGGWHFNNLYSPKIISKKLMVFPHQEFSSENFSKVEIIKKKIQNLEDLFNRNHKYKKIYIDNTYPKIVLEKLSLFKKYIL